MNRTKLLIAIGVLLLSTLASVQIFANQPETPKEAEATNLSTFPIPTEVRNPFWPVGWVPGRNAPVEVKQEAPPKVTTDSFALSAVLLGPPHFAVINGRDYGEGDLVTVPVSGGSATVKVVKIADGFVLLDYEGNPITVEIRR